MGPELQGLGFDPTAYDENYDIIDRQQTSIQRDPAMMSGQKEAVAEPKINAALPVPEVENNHIEDSVFQQSNYD